MVLPRGGEALVVYWDLILLINWGFDFWLLWLTAKVGNLKNRAWTFGLGAVPGALSGLLPYLTLPYWVRIPLFIAAAELMLRAAFPGRKPPRLTFVLAAISGGGAFLLLTRPWVQVEAGTGVFVPAVLPGLALATAAALYGLASLCLPAVRQDRNLRTYLCPARITINGKTITVDGLVDTGNRLRLTASDAPVAVVSMDRIAEVLPQDVLAVVSKKGADRFGATVDFDDNWAVRLRFIPYQSVGTRGDVLLGVRTDEVNGVANAVVAIYPGKLSPQGEFGALLPVALAMVTSTKGGKAVC
jgi:stage II sporulation protein GA (sporulation sigma-E factor processing peptidase)